MIKVSKPVRDGSVRVTFALPADEPPGAVSVVGNFNDWNPFTHPLRKRSNGTRSTVVTARPGTTLQFRYLAEGGHWFDDEAATVNGQEPPSRSDVGFPDPPLTRQPVCCSIAYPGSGSPDPTRAHLTRLGLRRDM